MSMARTLAATTTATSTAAIGDVRTVGRRRRTNVLETAAHPHFRLWRLASAVRALRPRPPRSDRRERSREGIQRPNGSQTRSPSLLLPHSTVGVVRCSPRFRRRSNATKSVRRRLWPSVESVGVGHFKPPVKGNRLRSLEPLCPRRIQVSTQKQEAPPSTSEGRVAPSAVRWGSSLHRQTLLDVAEQRTFAERLDNATAVSPQGSLRTDF